MEVVIRGPNESMLARQDNSIRHAAVTFGQDYVVVLQAQRRAVWGLVHATAHCH